MHWHLKAVCSIWFFLHSTGFFLFYISNAYCHMTSSKMTCFKGTLHSPRLPEWFCQLQITKTHSDVQEFIVFLAFTEQLWQLRVRDLPRMAFPFKWSQYSSKITCTEVHHPHRGRGHAVHLPHPFSSSAEGTMVLWLDGDLSGWRG